MNCRVGGLAGLDLMLSSLIGTRRGGVDIELLARGCEWRRGEALGALLEGLHAFSPGDSKNSPNINITFES